MKKKISIGLLAHVDAGKTTLSEALLYMLGKLKTLGRVDAKDSFFDSFEIERQRGITVFSKEARLELEDTILYLLDTPGHMDFSAEMERTLSILDYAILILPANAKLSAYTKTLWQLLEDYHIPCFVFVNKIDIPGFQKDEILRELRELSKDLMEFTHPDVEELALFDEKYLEKYMLNGNLEEEDISELIQNRQVFPLYFGSALKLDGVKELIDGMLRYTKERRYQEELAYKVYKVSRDKEGNRQVHMKLFGGSLRVKDSLKDDKINQIRLYQSGKYEVADEVSAGDIFCITGNKSLRIGDSHHISMEVPILKPILRYNIEIKNMDVRQAYPKLMEIADENPEISVEYNTSGQGLQANLMGKIQMEILETIARERYGIELLFSEGSIIYKESIEGVVYGLGHYEPLGHYAEVLLRIEGLERGSGILVESLLREEDISINYQKLVLSHIKEKAHKGVLLGSAVTDIKISLLGAKAHKKHTEGGDFRQATYRAIRQALMQAKGVVLEPFYDFEILLPADNVGRVLHDLSHMQAEFAAPEILHDVAKVRGYAPAKNIQNYADILTAYSKGQGQISLRFKHYDNCKDMDRVVEEHGYMPEMDEENPSGSIFCKSGAGFYVPWNEVFSYMHIEYNMPVEKEAIEEDIPIHHSEYRENEITNQELIEIFERTYGKIKPRIGDWESSLYAKHKEKEYVYKENPKKKRKTYVLIDGYNLIFSSESLSDMANSNMDAARDSLIDWIVDYKAYVEEEIILVFDAYRVKGHKTEIIKEKNIYVVYTKEAETADQYIEKTAHEMNDKYDIVVVTSDRIEQIIIRTKGSVLLSSREFLKEMVRVKREAKQLHEEKKLSQPSNKTYLLDALSEAGKRELEEIRFQEEN